MCRNTSQAPLVLLLLVAVVAFTACTSDTTDPGPVTPATYDSTGFGSATQAEFEIRSNMASLVALMKTARQPGVRLSQSEIASRLAPLSGFIPQSFTEKLATYSAELADASGGTLNWLSRPGMNANGGTYGGYLFSEHGLEMEQMIDKGLYGAMFYTHARSLVASAVTKENVHRMLALFGANPDFPNTDRAQVRPDVFAAAYCARRDQNDGRGMYSEIRREFIRAQTAISESKSAEARLAVEAAFRLWERAIMATVINYTYTVVTELSATNPSDSSRGLAMHAYGECIGFLTGWRFVNAADRTITTAQIDELLSLLKAPLNGPWTCYDIWQQPQVNLTRVVNARETLQSIYSFSDEEMISFKSNWVNVQGRR